MGALLQTAVPLQDFQKQSLSSEDSSKDCGSSSKCNKVSVLDSTENEEPRVHSIRPPEKRQRVPSAYNRFIKEEIQRIKASNPDISHREAFSTAAKNEPKEVSYCFAVGTFPSHSLWSVARWQQASQNRLGVYCRSDKKGSRTSPPQSFPKFIFPFTFVVHPSTSDFRAEKTNADTSTTQAYAKQLAAGYDHGGPRRLVADEALNPKMLLPVLAYADDVSKGELVRLLKGDACLVLGSEYRDSMPEIADAGEPKFDGASDVEVLDLNWMMGTAEIACSG
ncbi:hypothetical protein HHK36_016926 [Tetracentron sinense]|uniref:YABBY protein C-terminal domain-containing protein n=1 Tax=Tetracentron sinense TaxID=13715 RepID=A0A834Z0E5_TETSI|nr:hypothetical protein HHK36_016926 [Tetracentron sinense]